MLKTLGIEVERLPFTGALKIVRHTKFGNIIRFCYPNELRMYLTEDEVSELWNKN